VPESKIAEPPKFDAVIECSSFPEDQRSELEAFLKSQPEIRSVSRVTPDRDGASHQYADRLGDTIGLIITHLQWDKWDLAVQFVDEVAAGVTTGVVLLGINEFWKRLQAKRKKKRQAQSRKAKPRRAESRTAIPRDAKRRHARQKNENYEWVLGSDGRTIKSVKKTED
jgi:hypothetical protein